MKAIQANIGGVAVYIQAEDEIEAVPPVIEEPDRYEDAVSETIEGPSGLTVGGIGITRRKPKTADNQEEPQEAKAADTKDAFEKAANLVYGLAEGLKEKFINRDNSPDELTPGKAPRQGVWMIKPNTAWRTVNAFKTNKGVRTLVRAVRREYSLSVGAKAEIVVVKAKAEAIFKVKMKWNKILHGKKKRY